MPRLVEKQLLRCNRKAGFCVVGLALLTAGMACGPIAEPEPAAEAPNGALVELSGHRAISDSRPMLETAHAFMPRATSPSLQAADVVLVADTSGAPDSRRLTLEYPTWIRVGDSCVIRLTLDAASLTNFSPSAGAGGSLPGDRSVKITNPHETYNVIAESRLDLEGTEVQPNTAVSEPLLPGESVAFRWSVRTTEAGTYRGTAWLVLVFVDKASGAQSRMAVSAQPVTIQATSLLGLGGGAARVLGGLGTVAAALLGIPVVPAVRKRLRSRPRTDA